MSKKATKKRTASSKKKPTPAPAKKKQVKAPPKKIPTPGTRMVKRKPRFRVGKIKILIAENGKPVLDKDGNFQTRDDGDVAVYDQYTDTYSWVSTESPMDYGEIAICSGLTQDGNIVSEFTVIDTYTDYPILYYSDPPLDPNPPMIISDLTYECVSYEETYTEPPSGEPEEPTYEWSDCDGTIGIRA